MQIGADMYCDSQCLICELERRHPLPSFFPSSDTDLLWFRNRWTNRPMFDLAVTLALGAAGDTLPKNFAEDRGRLYLGSDWSEGLKAANVSFQHMAAQFRTALGWSNDQFSDNRNFLIGQAPAAIDAQLYHMVLVYLRSLGPRPCLFV